MVTLPFNRIQARILGSMAGLISLFSCTGDKTQQNEVPSQPNILFISVDDLRPALGYYGNIDVKSPNLDKLASSSTTFNRAYCQAPVSMPSRTSLMSGIHPENYKNDGSLSSAPLDTLLPGVLSLPDHFKKNNYKTISVGKTYHHNFDDNDGWSKRYTETFTEEKYGAQGYASGYQNPEYKKLVYNYINAWSNPALMDSARPPATEKAQAPDSAYPDGKITNLVIEELRNLKKSKTPFFIAAGFYRPHLPFTPPKRYWDMYDPADIDLANNPYMPEYGISFTDWNELRRYGDIPQKGDLSDKKARQLIHGYYASVSFIDAQIGKIMQGLEELGMDQNTIIILWGDHGWNLGEHGLWCKHTNYEISTRTALMIKWPGVTTGKKTDALAGLIDLYPTVCEMTNLPIPKHVEGNSLVPVLMNPDTSVNNAVFTRWFTSYSMRTDRYRFIKHDTPNKIYNAGKDTTGIYEIYDHKSDPQENINIAYKPENKGLLRKLKKKMAKEGHRSFK